MTSPHDPSPYLHGAAPRAEEPPPGDPSADQMHSWDSLARLIGERFDTERRGMYESDMTALASALAWAELNGWIMRARLRASSAPAAPEPSEAAREAAHRAFLNEANDPAGVNAALRAAYAVDFGAAPAQRQEGA